MNNATLAGNISFEKGVGFITASVQRPFVTITKYNFYEYFKLNNTIAGYEGAYIFVFDFSYGLIINSVPDDITTIYISYNILDIVAKRQEFLTKYYGNIFSVINNTGKDIEIIKAKKPSFIGRNLKTMIFKAGQGYLNYEINTKYTQWTTQSADIHLGLGWQPVLIETKENASYFFSVF